MAGWFPDWVATLSEGGNADYPVQRGSSCDAPPSESDVSHPVTLSEGARPLGAEGAPPSESVWGGNLV